MSTAKVIEIIAEGSSIEEAIGNGVKEVAKSVHAIKGVWVENTQAVVEGAEVTAFRVNLKITFVVD